MLATCTEDGSAIRLSPLRSTPTAITPSKVPSSQPLPRSNEVPPTATAAMASNSSPRPAVGCPEFMRAVINRPAMPAMVPPSA